VSPDDPELRMLAQLAGIAPARLAAALNDVEHIRDHMTVDEGQRLIDAMGKLLPLVSRINAAIAAGKRGT